MALSLKFRQLSFVPEAQNAPALFLLVITAGLSADGSCKFLQVLCHIGTGKVADRIASADRLHHTGVLVGNLPVDLAMNHLLDLVVRDETTLLVSIEDDADPLP